MSAHGQALRTRTDPAGSTAASEHGSSGKAPEAQPAQHRQEHLEGPESEHSHPSPSPSPSPGSSPGFPIKRLPDGRALLNLGCGTRAHPGWTNVDFSPYARLAGHKRLAATARRLRLLSEDRYRLLRSLDPDVIHWDLRRGVPFPGESFDAAYHSHLLEHLDREDADRLLKECLRVLRPGGVIRVVVPDLRYLAERYLESLAALERDPAAAEAAGDESAGRGAGAGAAGGAGPRPGEEEAGTGALARHEEVIEELFGQMVRREYTGRRDQHPLIRRLERLVRGDAASTGELHRWMYDRYTLGALLRRTGFVDVREERADTSRMRDWPGFELDTNPDGSVYKPESLFMEAVRPGG